MIAQASRAGIGLAYVGESIVLEVRPRNMADRPRHLCDAGM
jgi:hypothetical protein